MNFEVIEKRNTTLNDAFSCNPQQLDTCGPEAKCEQIKENVYQCICKNDSLLTPNLNCSRIPDLPVPRDQENIDTCDEDGDCGNDAVCRTSSIYKNLHCVCKSDGSSTSSDLKCPPSQLREQPPMNTTHENPKLTGCDPNCGEGLQVIPPEEKIDNQEIIHCVPKQKDKKCGAEGACALVNNTHVCICPQDGSLYYPGRICQLKKVAGVPVGTHKSKFHVDVHTSASLSPSTAKTHLSNNSRSDLPIHSQRHLPSWNGLHPNNDTVISTPSVRSSSRPVSVPPVISEHGIIILAAALVLSLSLLVLILIWLYNRCISFRKNGKTHKDKAFAIPLRKNILTEERYTTNPHYTSAGSTSDSGIPMVPIILRSSITDLEKIGEGFFGKVYKGQLHVPDDNGAERIETVAVKMLKHTTNLEAEEDFMREVEIMSSFEHSNILTLIGLCPRENTLSPWMVFEFMPLGDLASVLRKSSLQFWSSVPTLPALSSESLLSIASQISEGMEYLARQRFVHRDLACRNCLVGSDLVVKIADFGMSRDVYTCDYYKIGGTRMLPVRWMSPESIVFGRFTLESDVWSYGVVLWEIYSYGKQPYYGHSNEEVLKFILDGILLSIPDDCPDDISDIMKACWRKDIKERIMFSEICARLLKLKESMNQQSIAALPRPPPLPVSLDHIALMADKAVDDDSDDEKSDDLLDEDNYLRPISRSESDLSGEYIEPLHMV